MKGTHSSQITITEKQNVTEIHLNIHGKSNNMHMCCSVFEERLISFPSHSKNKRSAK